MKLKEGDLFKMQISESSYAIGQILSIPKKDSLTVIVFEGLYNTTSSPNPDEITQEQILFLANTFDAKFYHKHWVIFANYPNNLHNIGLPIYKLGTENSPQYEDFFQNQLPSNTINSIEKDKIGYRNYVAPIRVENAVKAFYKIEEWKTDYDKLLYKNLIVK